MGFALLTLTQYLLNTTFILISERIGSLRIRGQFNIVFLFTKENFYMQFKEWERSCQFVDNGHTSDILNFGNDRRIDCNNDHESTIIFIHLMLVSHKDLCLAQHQSSLYKWWTFECFTTIYSYVVDVILVWHRVVFNFRMWK